jgi:hypothetical protein
MLLLNVPRTLGEGKRWKRMFGMSSSRFFVLFRGGNGWEFIFNHKREGVLVGFHAQSGEIRVANLLTVRSFFHHERQRVEKKN